MKLYHHPVHMLLVFDLLFFLAMGAMWFALAYAQCVPNDLNCMNLP